MIALTSRMIFAFAAASNFSSLTVKIVFSFGFSTSSAGAAPAPAAPPAGAAEAAGMATSVMLSFSFRAVTSSETSSNDKVEICSTSGAIFGDKGAEEADEEEAAVSAIRRGEVVNERKIGVGCILLQVSHTQCRRAKFETYLETWLDRSATRSSVLVDRYKDQSTRP